MVSAVRHPFDRTPPAALRKALAWGAGVSLVLGFVLLQVLERGPGLGQLAALVLAGTPEAARVILSGWTPADRLRVAFVAGFDLAFGVAWTNTLGLGCIWAARRFAPTRPASLGAPIAWLLWIAMLLDVPENGAYLRMVLGSVDRPWPAVALFAVYARTLIFFAGCGYVLAGLVRAGYEARPSR